VINSMPFYGSHGGFIWNHRQPVQLAQKKDMKNFFINSLFTKFGFESLTIVDPLFEKNWTPEDLPLQIESTLRIGQYSIFESNNANVNFDEYFSKTMPAKKMWDIRKARKSELKVGRDLSDRALVELYELHKENMLRIGGSYKSMDVFFNLPQIFKPGVDYDIYIARDGEIAIAGLCVLYFRNQVEYFIPAVKFEYRSSQILSLLIHEAMRDAFERHKSYCWNWGGTWESQIDLYRFKESWSALSKEYHYHTFLKPESKLFSLERSAVLNHYKYFFCFPFV